MQSHQSPSVTSPKFATATVSPALKSITSATQLPQTGFVRLPKVLSIYPVSKSTWWAGIKSGKYPAGIKLSERVTAWRVEDIHALISQLAPIAS